MTYQPYDTYKDSAQAWLGDIPEHWDTRRIKFLFKIKKRIAGTTDWDVLSITQSGIKVKDITSGEGQLAMDYSKYQIVEKNDFAMNHMDLLTGYVDISKYDGVTSPDYRVFTLTDDTQVKEYYLHLFQTGYKNKIFFAFGQGSSQLGRWRLPADEFNNFVVPVPPPKEQKAIAEFINKKTSQIDAHIAKQEKLIELLKERRTAAINKAVTRGLDESVTCKDSCIEWLGEIPEHWEIRKIKHIVRINPSSKAKGIQPNTQIEFVPMENVSEEYGRIKKYSFRPLSEIAQGYTAFRNEDVIFAKITPCMENGNCAIVQNLTHNIGYGSTEFIVFRATKKIIAAYLHSILRDKKLRTIAEANMHGSAGQKRIATGFLANYFIGLPPLEEQRQIVSHISDVNEQAEKSINLIEKEIASLKEYRQSLISNAVTGKIKVVENI
ncbi:MAG: restriction endonuclease subunit S [Campylobacterales bacterium]|nr:restriction endonuclease subunit S [Campylobacterales bacterium]